MPVELDHVFQSLSDTAKLDPGHTPSVVWRARIRPSRLVKVLLASCQWEVRDGLVVQADLPTTVQTLVDELRAVRVAHQRRAEKMPTAALRGVVQVAAAPRAGTPG